MTLTQDKLIDLVDYVSHMVWKRMRPDLLNVTFTAIDWKVTNINVQG